MRYDQLFWVGHNNPRFPTARNGYLPALEPKEELGNEQSEEPLRREQIHYHFRMPESPKRKSKYNKYLI